MAAGDEASKLKTKQLLIDKAGDGRAQSCFARPEETDASPLGALLSDELYEEASDYDEQQLVFAATMIAADVIKTKGFVASAVYRHLDISIPAASARGRCCCDPFFLEMVPWFPAVTVANGVSFGPGSQLVGHKCLL